MQAGLARANLELGKVALLDCIPVNELRNGNFQRLRDSKDFEGFQVDLVHFVMDDEEEMRQRILQRAVKDSYAAKRVEFKKAQDPDTFHKFVTEEQPMRPIELRDHRHLLLDTSGKTPLKCAGEVLDYVCDI